METRRIAPGIFVSGQIEPSDIPTLEGMAIKTLIALRPDGEDPGQPLFETFETWARGAGVAAHRLPVSQADPTQAEAAAFAKVMETAARPVLAYSGTSDRAEAVYRTVFGTG